MPLDRQQRVVFVAFTTGLLVVCVVVALFDPIVWLVTFPLAFIVAAMLDPG